MTEKKEIKERFELVEVTTQTGLAFKDNSDESVLDLNQVILRMANDIEKIRKGVAN